MALKVIGAGFGRTGTMSLKAALETLGYMKTHHMIEVLPDPRQRDLWEAVAEGAIPDWDDIFKGFQASCDFPSSIFYRELAGRYPEAKVILTVRSAESWYESAHGTIYAVGKAVPGWITSLIPQARQTKTITNGLIWDKIFDGRFEDVAHAKQVFLDHIDTVMRTIPAERLLVYEVKTGWEPLCAFLGHEVPVEPFPHVNDKAEFHAMIKRMQRIAWLPLAFLGGAGLFVLAGLIWTLAQ